MSRDITKLLDKKIRVSGDLFDVVEAFNDNEANEEVLVLSRTKPCLAPKTIQDLGYTSTEDVWFEAEEREQALGFIDHKQGQEIDIAMVEISGIIELKSVELIGSVLTEPQLYRVIMDGEEHKMGLDFIVKAFLLAQEFIEAQLKAGEDTAEDAADEDDMPDMPDFIKDLIDSLEKDPTKRSSKKSSVEDVIKDILGDIKGTIKSEGSPMNNLDNALDDFLEGFNEMRKTEKRNEPAGPDLSEIKDLFDSILKGGGSRRGR